jgi:hypothetical protein
MSGLSDLECTQEPAAARRVIALVLQATAIRIERKNALPSVRFSCIGDIDGQNPY